MDHKISKKNDPSVAIILVNWNSFDVTNDCILSLKKISYQDYTIVLVDNGSADGSGRKLQNAHPDIVMLFSATNLGFTGGNNLGFRYSLENGFDYSMMLNNDTFVEPDFLTVLIHIAASSENIGAVQPRIHFNHNRQLLWNGGSYFNPVWGFAFTQGENGLPNKKHLVNKQVDWITGCAFLIKNSVLEKTGLLAENMFIYSEDVDLSFRIREQGFILMYVADAIVYHIAGMSNKSKTKGKEGYVNPIVHYLNQRNRIWLIKRYTKWQYFPTTLIANFFYIMLIIGYFAARCRFGKVKAMINAIRDGVRGSIKYN